MEKENVTRKRVQILSALLVLAVLGFLGYRYLAPFGKTVYYRFTSKLPEAEEITTFSPGENSVLKIPHQVIKTAQSKLSLKLLSKDVESIKTELKFKEGPKEIKLGVRGNEKDNFFYQPLYHSLIQDLNWEKIEEGGFTLWQKEKKYQTLYDLLNNPPQDKKIASYFTDLDKLSILKSTEAKREKEAKTIIDTPLRSSHSLLIRLDRKPLVLKVAKQDTNAYEGEDKLKITVLEDSTTLAEKTIKDDGIIDTSRLKTEPQEETITFEEIKPGMYQVDIVSESEGGDLLITKIEINQTKVVFRNHVFILGGKPTTFWTNILKLYISTAHEGSLQTVKLNDQYPLEITEVGKQHPFNLEALAGPKETEAIYKLESPKNDLIIQGDGYFAFSKDSFFYPEVLKSVDLNTLTNLEDIDYVLTTCPQAKQEGDWLVAETSFDPKKIKIEDDKLYFSLESPELARYGGELEIDYLEIAVKSKGILEKEEPVEEEIPAEELEEVKESKNIFQRIWQSVFNFFDKIGTTLANTISKVFKRGAKPSEEEEPTTSSAPSPSPSPSPSPTPEAEKISILVKVLNGGAGKGEAGKFAKKLEENGFTNTKADNADKSDYKNALIQYRSEDKKTVDKVVDLLKEDYKTIDKKEIATTSAEIVVIVGEK